MPCWDIGIGDIVFRPLEEKREFNVVDLFKYYKGERGERSAPYTFPFCSRSQPSDVGLCCHRTVWRRQREFSSEALFAHNGAVSIAPSDIRLSSNGAVAAPHNQWRPLQDVSGYQEHVGNRGKMNRLLV